MENSSSNSSETQDSQTIVITPTQLKELGLADQLKSVIQVKDEDQSEEDDEEEDEEEEEEEPEDEESEENAMEVDLKKEKIEEDTEENEAVEDLEEKTDPLKIDPKNLQKTMKSKLCTLLNHTPLVMQVKNSPWNKIDTSNQNISIINAKQVVNIDLNDQMEDDKRKLTIFSNEKLNFTPTEIENMLSTGKSVYSISSPAKSSIEIAEIHEKETQSTSQDTKDPGVLKKQCLKRIQAKMYENLKKVLDEVDSFPVKEKAALSIKPFATSEDLDSQSAAKSQNVSKVTDKNKDSKDKPCYMSTFRERKIIELADKNNSSSSPKPADDVIVIPDGDSEELPEANIPSEITVPTSEKNIPTSDDVVKIPKKRGRPPKNPAVLKIVSEVKIVEQDKSKIDTATPEPVVRKRGRPPKKSIINVTIIEESKKSEESPQNLEEKSKVEKQNGASEGTPTPRKRGRPRKIRPVESPEEEQMKVDSDVTPIEKESAVIEINAAKNPVIEGTSEVKTAKNPVIEGTPEVKIPKKRGRKPKAVVLALREAERIKKEAKNTPEDGSSSREYTNSKSGRKRKIVNYSLLNGESSDYSPSDDSDEDEIEIKVKKAVRSTYRRKSQVHIKQEDGTDDEDDDDDNTESRKAVKRTRVNDVTEKDVVKKPKIEMNVKENDGEKKYESKTSGGVGVKKGSDAAKQADASDDGIDDEDNNDESKITDASDGAIGAEKSNDESKNTDASDDAIGAEKSNEKSKKADASDDAIGAEKSNEESKKTDASDDGIGVEKDHNEHSDTSNDEIIGDKEQDEPKKTDASDTGLGAASTKGEACDRLGAEKNDEAKTDAIGDEENDKVKQTDVSNDAIGAEQKNYATIKHDELTNVEKVKCGVCNMELDESSWLEHKRKSHNDLAWRNGEEPLDLEDATIVGVILNKVLKDNGVLGCENCELTMDSIPNFIDHIKDCKTEIDSGFLNRRKPRTRKKKSASAQVLSSLFSNIDSAKKEEDISEPLTEEVEDLNPVKVEQVELQKDQAQCGVCQKILQKTQWSNHKLSIHNNLAWRVGDKPLDLKNHQLVVKILTDLYNRKKPLFCDNCGSSRKSVIGFLSHKSRCNKSSDEISDMKVSCKLCDKRMLPVSLARHIVLLHGADSNRENPPINEDNKDEVLGGKRKAAHKAFELIQNIKDESPAKIKRFVKGVRFRSKDEIITRFNEEIQNYQEASCVFENCNYTAAEAEDLFQHLDTCLEKCDDGYTCNYCLATFKLKRTVRDHVTALHVDDDKNCIIMHNISSDEESYNDNNASDADEKDDEFGTSKIKMTYIKKTLAKFLANTKKKATNSCYPYAYKWTIEYYEKNCSVKNIFPDIIPNKNAWNQIKSSDIHNYLPKLKRSIDFAYRTVNTVQNPIESNYNWINYKLFESSIDKDGSSTIFCGGPVSSMTWVPTPYNQPNSDQILAVSVLPGPDKNYYRLENYRNEGLIQFWNYGRMDNKKIGTTKPNLEFCIGHKLGPIWCMEWCPSGCYDGPEVDGLKKLGLLAVTSTDGGVYIYTVLQPKQLQGKIFEVKPTIKLISEDYQDQNLGDNHYQATRMSWSKVTGHSYIAVGYSNGVVAIFNLNTKSKLLRNVVDDVVIFKPIQQFKPHHDCITALVLHHLNDGNRWLVTGALDRECKFWDLRNVLEPLTSTKKFIITDAIWSLHWLFALYTFDHATLAGSVPSGLIPVRSFNGTGSTFLPSNSRTTSISCSDWGNVYIQANDNGEVTCGFPDQLLQDFDADKRKSVRKCRILTSYTGFVAKYLSPQERKQIELKKMAAEKKKNAENNENSHCEPRTYDEFYNDYGLVICDLSMNYKKTNPSEELDKLMHNFPYHSLYKPNVYPMQTINKIVLNPNRNSFLYYACGYQAGLVRTSVLKFLNNP